MRRRGGSEGRACALADIGLVFRCGWLSLYIDAVGCRRGRQETTSSMEMDLIMSWLLRTWF